MGLRDDGVLEIIEVSVDFLIFNLVVCERSLRHRVPVHQTLTTINETVLEQTEEGFAHGLGPRGVHREGGAVEVAGAAHRLELAEDRLLVLVLPALDLCHELVARVVGPPLALGLLEALFDDRLRGDAGVVGAGNPHGVLPLHPRPADEDVLDRVVERVPQVQRRRHVRRRDHDAERLAGVGRLGVEEVFGVPNGGDLRLHVGGGVARGKLGGVRLGHGTGSLAPFSRERSERYPCCARFARG